MILSLCLFYLKEMSSTWWKATAADCCDTMVLRAKILWICPSSWTFKNSFAECSATCGSLSLKKVELEAEPLATKLLSCVISSQYGFGRQPPSPYLKVISTHSSLIEIIVRVGSGKSWTTSLLKHCCCWLIFVQSHIIYIPCNNYGCIRMLSVCIGRGGVDDVTGCPCVSWWRDVNSNDRCEFLRQTVGTHPNCEQFNVSGKETFIHMHMSGISVTLTHMHVGFPSPSSYCCL